MRRKRRTRHAAPASEVTETVKVPHDPVNEQVVLAATMVSDKGQALLESLPPECFFGKGHAEAWEVLRSIKRQGLSYDPATVRQLSGGKVDAEYLEQLAQSRPAAPPNLAHHVECLWWDKARVETARGPLASLLEALRDPTSDPSRVRGLAKQLEQGLKGTGTQRYLADPARLTREVRGILQRRLKGEAVFPYCLDGLDSYSAGEYLVRKGERIELEGRPRMVPGTAPGQMTVLSAVPGGGKTTFLSNMVLGQARQGRRTLLGAWEQREAVTLESLAATALGIGRSELASGAITEQDAADIEAETEALQHWVRFFELPFGRARGGKEFNDRNLDIIHGVCSDSGCDIFIADLFRRALKETHPDDEEQAIYRMQSMAHELRMHFVLAQQQRAKEVEARDDKRPSRDTIKGSGAWFEVPDTVIALHRPGLWKHIDDDRIEALILKQRYGRWPLAVEFDWDAELGTIGNGRGVEFVHHTTEGERDNDDPLGFVAKSRSKKRRH